MAERLPELDGDVCVCGHADFAHGSNGCSTPRCECKLTHPRLNRELPEKLRQMRLLPLHVATMAGGHMRVIDPDRKEVELKLRKMGSASTPIDEYIPRAQANEAQWRPIAELDIVNGTPRPVLLVAPECWPVIYRVPDRGDGVMRHELSREPTHFREMPADPWENEQANEARRVTCGECRSYQLRETSKEPYGITDCVHPKGLSDPRPCDWCSYAEPRKARGE